MTNIERSQTNFITQLLNLFKVFAKQFISTVELPARTVFVYCEWQSLTVSGVLLNDSTPNNDMTRTKGYWHIHLLSWSPEVKHINPTHLFVLNHNHRWPYTFQCCVTLHITPYFPYCTSHSMCRFSTLSEFKHYTSDQQGAVSSNAWCF